jgi:hypothetical protein
MVFVLETGSRADLGYENGHENGHENGYEDEPAPRHRLSPSKAKNLSVSQEPQP